MKQKLTLFLALMVAFCALAPAASATESTEETVYIQPERPAGYCGESILWAFDEENGTLILSGDGEMDDLTEFVPWEEYKEEIKTLIVTGKLTYLGAYAFADYDALEAVNLGSTLTHIGVAAFKDCDGLTELSLPATFRRFGEDSLRSCDNLTAIHCAGGFPSFNLNCLWDTCTKIYYPAERPWGLEYIEQLESAFQGRIEFLASDGTDPYVPTLPADVTEPTAAPTEETTAPTEPAEAATEPVTEPVTEATTEPTAAPTTLPAEESTEPEETEEKEYIRWTEATEEIVEKRPAGGQKGWIGICIISGILSLVLIGALIFGRRSRR